MTRQLLPVLLLPPELRRAYRLLGRVHDLSPGQIVTWKPGLENRDQPALSEPLVVLELLDEPLDDDAASVCTSWPCHRRRV